MKVKLPRGIPDPDDQPKAGASVDVDVIEPQVACSSKIINCQQTADEQ